MPEGDTIFRAAATLQRALAGRVVTKFETQLPQLSRIDIDAPIAGRTIERVDATGKWMRMFFSGDLILLTHMLMNGSWHIYRPGEKWKRPHIQMRIAIYTAEFVAVAFQVPIAQFHTADTLARHPSVRNQGPDILSQDFDAAEAMRNMRARPELEIGEGLLRQWLIAGIGNVFKSEVCFAARINPFRPVSSLSDQELESLIAQARKFMRNSARESGMRNTTRRMNPAERLWVYHRAGQPCRRCGTPIQSRKQGADVRTTFWCPNCQAGH